MALNPPSKNQPKGQPAKPGESEKSPRVSAPPALNPSGPQSAEPQRIGKYEIQKILGSGGMGTVYLATDTQLRRQVALKVLPKEKAENPQLVKRFQAEAQSAAHLRHENIVTVYEAGFSDGYLFMALEFVDGIDTAELILRRGVVPFKRSIEIVRQVLKALEHAFSKSIVHRDIKPANLMIRRDGLVKLTDLGLARSREDPLESGITRAGTTVGTIDYMSPEQARDSKAADVRSDIYSLGCTWYFLLTGQAPYPEGNLTNKLRAHSETPFPDPRLITPGVPEGIVAVMRRMTEKDPRKRYQTPSDVLADLDLSNSSRSLAPELALNELEKEEAGSTTPDVRRNPRSTTEGMPPADSPPGRARSKSKAAVLDEQTPQRDVRWIFYGAVAAGALAVLGGVGWLINSYSHTWDTPRATGSETALSSRKAIQHTLDPHGSQNSRGTPQDGPTTSGSPNEPANNPPNQNPEAGTTQPLPRTTDGNQQPDSKSSTAKAPSKVPAKESRPVSADIAGTLTLPTWVREPRPAASDRVITVRKNPRKAGEAATLHAALASITVGSSDDSSVTTAGVGTVVELDGPGPFLLRPFDLIKRSRVIVRARADSSGSATQPLVILLPTEAGTSPPAVLRCDGTQLELQGIHFALATTAFTSPLESLISVRNGHVFVERCTFTVPTFSQSTTGTPRQSSAALPLTALRVLSSPDENLTGKSGEPSRILIDDCVFRGPRLTVLATESPNADIVIRNTFGWAGSAPALRLQAPPVGSGSKSRLVTSLFRSTLISQICGFELTRDVADGTGLLTNAIAIGLSDTLIAAPAGSERPTLVSLPGWSRANARAACGKLLTWQSIQSLYLGWNRLIDLPLEGLPGATTFGEWQTLFEVQSPQRQPFGSAEQFQKPAWPARVPVEMAAFDPISLGPLAEPIQKPAKGGWPGAAPRDFTVPDVTSLLASARELRTRPKFPEFLLDGMADSYPIHVNLMRDDLGKYLSNMKLKTGMTIIASGSDRHLCTPFSIDGVWIRIRFEQTDGPPLILTPRAPDFFPTNADDAFIAVRNGGLELSHAVFEPPADEQKPIPKWYVQGLNSDLVLKNCRLAGPMVGTRNVGVVQWLRTGYGTPARPPEFPKDPEALLVVQDSWLSGGGTVIQADLPRRALFARNSMLVARDTLFDLRTGGRSLASSDDSFVDPTLDLERCTLSAAGRVFQFAAPTFPLRVFAECCMVAPPLKVPDRNGSPVLLSYPGPELDQRQIRWTESYCGYAPELKHFVQLGKAPGDAGAGADFTADWERRWGPLFVNSPLTGTDGVVLAGPLPAPRKVTPASFQLGGSALAKTWAPFQKLIGADLKTMKLPEARPGKAASPVTPPKPPPSRNPSPRKQPPKVDTGF